MRYPLPTHDSRRMAFILAGCSLFAAQEGERRRTPMPRPVPVSDRGFSRAEPRSSHTARPGITGPAVTHQRLATGTAMATFAVVPACTVVPTVLFWHHRDLMTEIQLAARTGFIPVTPFPGDLTTMQHYSMAAPGWRAYGFLVPPHGKLRVDLVHEKPAWFRVFWIDKWGSYRPGMMIKPGEPQALYENMTDQVQAVYAIADDPGHWSNEASPYTLKVARSWDPKTFDPKGVQIQEGIWAFDPILARVDASRP